MVLRGAASQLSVGRKKLLPQRHTSSVCLCLCCGKGTPCIPQDRDGEGSAVDGEGFAEVFREGRVEGWGAPSAAPTNPVL